MTGGWGVVARLTCVLATAGTVAVILTAAPIARGQDPDSLLSAITGVVTSRADGQPLEGVRVRLGRVGAAFVDTQQTDAKGRFAFVRLTPGAYTLYAQKPGFGDGQYGSGVMGSFGGRIVLSSGEWFQQGDMALAKLGAVQGRLLDEAGEPVVGAYVRVLRRVRVGGRSSLAAGPIATTDDRGDYRIADLSAGDYLVMVPSVQAAVPVSASTDKLAGANRGGSALAHPEDLIPGISIDTEQGAGSDDTLTGVILGNYSAPPPPEDGHPRAYPIEFFPGATTVSGAATVSVLEGVDQQGIDLTLQPVSAHRLTGRLIGSPGTYEGVVLRLVKQGLESLGMGSEAATTAVAPDGSFGFLNVPDGEYRIVAPGASSQLTISPSQIAGRPPRLPNTPMLGRWGSGEGGGLIAADSSVQYESLTPNTFVAIHAPYADQPVSVRGADVLNLTVPTEPTAALRCHVVADPASATLSGFLELAPADGDITRGVHTYDLNPPNSGPPSSDVSIIMPVLMPGDYAIRPMGGTGTLTIESLVVDGRDATTGVIHLASGDDSSAELTLTSKGGSLSGMVLDGNGAPVPDASVVLFPKDSALWRGYGFLPTWIRESVGSSDGSYSITRVRAGEYNVVAVRADEVADWTQDGWLTKASRTAQSVSMTWGQAKTVDVRLVSVR